MGEIKKKKRGRKKTSGKERVHSVTSRNSPRLPIETSFSLQWEEGMLGETLIHSSYLAFGFRGQQVNHLTPTKKKKKCMETTHCLVSGLWLWGSYPTASTGHQIVNHQVKVNLFVSPCSSLNGATD